MYTNPYAYTIYIHTYIYTHIWFNTYIDFKIHVYSLFEYLFEKVSTLLLSRSKVTLGIHMCKTKH